MWCDSATFGLVLVQAAALAILFEKEERRKRKKEKKRKERRKKNNRQFIPHLPSFQPVYVVLWTGTYVLETSSTNFGRTTLMPVPAIPTTPLLLLYICV